MPAVGPYLLAIGILAVLCGVLAAVVFALVGQLNRVDKRCERCADAQLRDTLAGRR